MYIKCQKMFFLACSVEIAFINGPNLTLFLTHHASLLDEAKTLLTHQQQTSHPTATTMATVTQTQGYPQDIITVPTHELHFNAPFNIKTTYHFRIINAGMKRIGYAFKTTKPKRIFINPPCGTLGSGDTLEVLITCATFDPTTDDLKHDRVIVEWCNTPDPTATVFKIEWFQEDGMVRRKNLPVVYNL